MTRRRSSHIFQGTNAEVFTGYLPFSMFRSVRRLELSPKSIYGGLTALVRGYVPGVILFQTLAGLLGIVYFVSPRYRLTVELLCQGLLKVSGPCARERSAGPKSAFATDVRTSNVKQVNEDPREIPRSAVDYPNGVLIKYPGRGFSWSPVPHSVFYSSTVRPGLVAHLWPRGRGLTDPNTRSCGG